MSSETCKSDVASDTTKEAKKGTPDTTKEIKKETPDTTKEAEKETPDTTKETEKEIPDTTKEIKKETPDTTKEAEKETPDTTKETEKEIPNTTKETKKDTPHTTEETKKEIPNATEETKKETPDTTEPNTTQETKKETPDLTEETKEEKPDTTEEPKKETPNTTEATKEEKPGTTQEAKKKTPETTQYAKKEITAAAKNLSPTKVTSEKTATKNGNGSCKSSESAQREQVPQPVTPRSSTRSPSSTIPSPTSEKAALALSSLFGSSSKKCPSLPSSQSDEEEKAASGGALSLNERLAAAAMIGGAVPNKPRAPKRLFSDVAMPTPDLSPVSTAKKSRTTGTYSRKDKSLGLLCENFMSRYGEMKKVDDSDGISIDAAANALGVERRRIYDIINILESIEIVRRKCKNTYIWYGKEHLGYVLARLQQQAFTMWPEDAKTNGLLSEGSIILNSDNKTKTESNKDKSLGRLSQKFIQMFLVGNNVLSLAEASEKILGCPSNSRNEEKGMKTKVRRLYDIANVMVSIGIIQKVILSRFKKPSFKWDFIPPPKLPEYLNTEVPRPSDLKSAPNKKMPVKLLPKKKNSLTPVKLLSSSTTSVALKEVQSFQPGANISPITKCKIQCDANKV